MSKKDIKSSNGRKGPHKYENEPEEGEIIDEYDLIVSSDEELSMRQRILELEAENEEIEQIAVISRSYVDKLKNKRAAQVPTDVSSISSTEFVTPQKRKRRKSKDRKKKHCHRQYPREHSHQNDQTFRYDLQKLPQKSHSKKAHCKRRQKLFAKKHKKLQSNRCIHKDINAEFLSLESFESSDSSSFTDADNNDYNWFTSKRKENTFKKGKYITRDTLRMAVARNTNESKYKSNKHCLKDKLLNKELVGQLSKNKEYKYVEGHEVRDDNDEDDDVQVIENEPIIQTIDEDSTDSIEEKELRLIALKSAVLKKHMARKIRNAKVAYSPTDFDAMISSSVLHPDSKMDDIDFIDLVDEDFQPACVSVSPETSPQLITLDDQEESQQMVDCQPVDMDIANSDSEDATIDSWSKDIDSCLHKFSPDPFDFAKNAQYGFFMRNLHELPPPPPGVDDYEDVPPPPPYHILFDAETQDMDVDNEDLTEGQQRKGEKEICTTEHKQIRADTMSVCPIKKEAEEDEEEEEEEALRALLLSKFQSPKNQHKSLIHKDVYECKETDAMKMNEFSQQNHSNPKPTETILKEAVKRLKIHSKTEACNDEKNFICYVEENSKSNDKPQEFSENSSENVLEKLRDRLNLYKNYTHSNTDQSQGNADKLLTETKEFSSSSYNEENKEQSAEANSFEVTNTIDISDITRRLQKIKENVLNSTQKINCRDHTTSSVSIPNVIEAPNENIEVLMDVQKRNKSSKENLCQLNIDETTSTDSNAVMNRNKTVEANFDINTHQTTFKVTIKNNVAVKPEENVNVNTLKDIHKENDDSNVPKNLPSKIVGNTCKKELRKERMVKFTNKITKSNIANLAEVNKPVPIIKPTLSDKVSSNTTYSLLRATKIVKPNKIINNNFDLNQKQISKTSELKASQSEANGKLTESPRLITSIDQVKFMCKVPPIVISLQNSSNESSEEDMEGDYNSLYKPLYDYNDNASPLSLNLDSPSITPLRSNSPIEPNTESVESLIAPTKETQKNREKIVVDITPYSEKTNKTPLAVRHLPAAAQSEYRKLVHRMKLLENKRKLSTTEENIANEQNNNSFPLADDVNKEKVKSNSGNSVLKSSLVKKVLIKNASSTTTSTTPNNSSKLNKSNVLRSYENLYLKLGSGIVNNLDKSLKLVEEAKSAKIAKLKLENRLKELKTEMDILQSKHKEEQQKINRIYPSICTTNDVISTLKQKRTKVYKAALNLGKTVKGDVYRLSNDLKETITTKSKKLATEIKTVNSLKAQNIRDMEDVMNEKFSEDQQIEENKMKNIEDCKTNTEGKIVEIEANKIATINTDIVCFKRCHEKEVEQTAEPLVKTDTGGNSEFQNMETDDSKTHEETDDSCRSDLNTSFNKTSLEMDCQKTIPLPSYKSPLEHLRNIDSTMDPNGVVCPYDLMGNCEDETCKYVHITPKAKT